MKYLKLIVPLAIVVLMLMIALPAAADDPFGGPPSRTSGNGASTWAAVYIANTCSAKQSLPAGGAMWFKYDTVKSVDTETYVDDVPKFGAAYNYFNKVTPKYGNSNGGDGNDIRLGIRQYPPTWATKEQAQADYWGNNDAAFDHGFAARLYDPANIKNMDYYWPTPNNALLTTRNGSRARVADTVGSYGGWNRGGASMLTIGVYGEGGGYSMLYHYDIKMADGQTHLLSARNHQDGWVYMRVYNAMIWDNDMMACTNYIRRGDWDYGNGGTFAGYYRP